MLKLPKSLITKIDIYKTNFLWGGDKYKISLNKVKWEKVCKPLEFGGLGFRDIDINNLALLAKMAWRVFVDPSSQITHLLKAKYVPDYDFQKNCSVSWRSILKVRDDVESYLRWSIGDGSNV